MPRGNRWLRALKLTAPVALIGVMACYDAPVETPTPSTTQETDVRVEQNIKNKVDILFMVDNSPSMSPKQNQLKTQFPLLIKILDDFGKMNPAWYHIGVVTSDLGAGQVTVGGNCVPGGNGAQLQAVGAGAPTSCVPPTGGVNFIDYNQLMPDANGNASSNLPAGQDLPTTFGCMASVGDQGCGFEMQLESVYKALHDNVAANHDFLRPDALLVVVFVTDEDDCSADPTTDLFDASPAGIQKYGALLSYRCTNYGIECGNPPKMMPYADSGGALMGCQSAPNPNGMGPGKLIDINKYINYFTQPSGMGGVKADPNDVIMFDITAPDSPVESILADPRTVNGPYQTCPGPIANGTCDVVLNHSCVAASDTSFFGDPAVRIRQVVKSVTHNESTSICDTSYQSALQSLGALIVSNIGAGCITSPFQDPANPDCVVEDITNTGNGTTVTEIPWCGANHENPTPCWELEMNPKCDAVCAKPGDPAQQFGVKIDRGNQPIPANTSARVACSTLAIPKPAGGFMCK